MSIKDFLREATELNQGDVFKVDVKDSFRFSTPKQYTCPKFWNSFQVSNKMAATSMLSLQNKKNVEETADLVLKKRWNRRKDEVWAERRGRRKDRKRDHGGRSPRRSSDLNLKVVVRPDREEPVRR